MCKEDTEVPARAAAQRGAGENAVQVQGRVAPVTLGCGTSLLNRASVAPSLASGVGLTMTMTTSSVRPHFAQLVLTVVRDTFFAALAFGPGVAMEGPATLAGAVVNVRARLNDAWRCTGQFLEH